MFGDMQVIDIANLTVAVVSLLVALVAFKISRYVSAMSVSRSFVIKELYDLYEDMRQRQRDFPKEFEAAVVQLADNIKYLRFHSLILEQTGFAEHLKTLNESAAEFSRLHTQLRNTNDNAIIKEKSGELLELHNTMFQAYLDLINHIEPKLRKILTNPFDD